MPGEPGDREQGRRGLRVARELEPATPLWQRVPTRAADGSPLSDFMLLIPGLRRRPGAEQARILDCLDQVLQAHRHAVVFADCNLKLNLLWVSVRPLPGICGALASALVAAVPEARLVAPEGPVTRRHGRHA
jgi:hypothetical protein